MSINSKFHDPIAPKKPEKKKSPWNFNQPHYDERSSCFVNAGSNYGVGHKQPVGKFKARGLDTVIPKGRPATQETDYIHHGKSGVLDIEADA